jgi:HAD superfamily hydrolase (TIGR01509 family)
VPTIDASRIRAWCFDVDGTLSDTDNEYAARIASMMPRIIPGDRRRLARLFVMSAEGPANAALALADRLHLDDEVVAMLNWAYRVRPRTRSTRRLVPGVREMLAALSLRYPLAVVSARDDRGTREFLDRFELTEYFTAIVTALTAEHTKPYADPIDFAARAMGVAASECVMVGDTTIDIRAASRAGSQSIGVLCGFGNERELRHMGATEILQTTTEIPRLLARVRVRDDDAPA